MLIGCVLVGTCDARGCGWCSPVHLGSCVTGYYCVGKVR